MADIVTKIGYAMSLRKPQQEALSYLDAISTHCDYKKDSKTAIEAVATEYCEKHRKIRVDDKFDFPSFCYAMATGIGKTRLMGACMYYLGITKAVNWQGGGGYHFYELAPSLLVKNKRLPIYQINPEYTFDMLCEAICKIEGFKYKPDGVYHGHSSENRFIHITKEFVNGEYIRSIATTLGENQSLLIYSTKVQSDLRLPDNIEVRRIPKDLLDKCTFESEVR